MRHLSLLAFALILAAPASAQIYQWRDAEGRVHYSDMPPAQGEAKRLRSAPPSTASPAPQAAAAPASADTAAAAEKPKTLAEKEQAFRERRAAAAEAQAKAEQESARNAERQRACEQARNQLAALRSGQRVVRFNSKGEREYLDDAARAAEVEQTQKYVDATCR